MINLLIGLVSFATIFAGALVGLFARKYLPGHHLSSETQSAVTVSVAVLGTLSALVLGLMITAADTSFSARSDDVRELSLQAIRMDRNLRRYGPETAEARAALRIWAAAKLQQLFPDERKLPVAPEETVVMLEKVQDAVVVLTPQNERQKYLRTLCLSLSSTMIQARWKLEQRMGHSIPVPFLVLLIFWLSLVFASFGLFAPPNPTVIVVLFLCSLAVSGGIYLIEELDKPLSGFIHVSPDSMRQALIQIESEN